MVNGSTVNPKGTLDSKIALLYLKHYALPHRQFPGSFLFTGRYGPFPVLFLFPGRHGQSPVFFFFSSGKWYSQGQVHPRFPIYFFIPGRVPVYFSQGRHSLRIPVSFFPKDGTVFYRTPGFFFLAVSDFASPIDS